MLSPLARCSKCREVKELSKFYKNKAQPNGHCNYCKVCFKTHQKRTVAPYKRDKHLRQRYGITEAQFNQLLQDQGNGCKICERRPEEVPFSDSDKRKRLVVDHDHETGQFRGIICYACNLGLGYFGDSLTRLSRASQYLRASRMDMVEVPKERAAQYALSIS